MKKYSFIGVGNMASAIISGMSNDIPTGLFNRHPEKCEKFKGDNFTVLYSAKEAVEFADFIVLSVKPQNIDEILDSIASSGVSTENKVFISIAAGITFSHIEEKLGKVAIIRAMPNTPLMLGKGVTALTRNEKVSDGDFSEIDSLFSSIGATVHIPEEEQNRIIAMTGSSPAYVYLFIKAVVDGAKAQGLDYPNMTELVCKVFIGASEMLMRSGKTPEELIRMVTSPKGTTEKAMDVLYDADILSTVSKAMLECTKRADELAEGK